MSFARTETQVMLADMADRLLAERNEFEDRRRRLGGAAPDRMALWPELAEQGLLGAAFSEDSGGFGGSLRDIATLMTAVGRHLLIEPVAVSAIAGGLLVQAGHPVGDVIAGQQVLVLAHDEGLDPFVPRRVKAVPQADGWSITGTKPIVRHADLADAYLVTAEIDGRLACLLVEASVAGVVREPTRLIDASSAATLHFDTAPATLLDLDPEMIRAGLARHACLLAAEAVGIMEALCSLTFAYLITRKQFGVLLATFQALQHRASDMKTATEAARALTDRAIEAVDQGKGEMLAFAAKALADDCGRLVGHDAVQLHGGMGVSDEYIASHYMRRLAAIRATLGGAAPLRAALGASSIAEQVADDVGELASFRQDVRDFVATALPDDIRAKGDKGLEFHKDDFVRWQKILREKDWFAGAWPQAMGGQDWDLARQLAFVQEAGRAGAPMIIPYGVNMVGPVLYTFGNEAQQARHLPGILSSDVWWCQGYSEPNAGSDLASLKTTAVRTSDSTGDYYVVNGTKMWTTEAHWADWMHCLVRTDRDVKPQAGISFLLIDMNTPGIEIRPIVTIDGQHHTNQVFFDDVRVPVENLVGTEGQGWSIAKFLLANERVAIADTGPKLKLLATIKTMLADLTAREGASTAVTLVADRLCEAEIKLAALCAMELDYVKSWQDGASRDGPEASILKIYGTEILQLLSEIALAIEGPMGAVHDPCDMHGPADSNLSPAQTASTMAHHYLYGRCWSIFGGTNEIQRGIIARTLLK